MKTRFYSAGAFAVVAALIATTGCAETHRATDSSATQSTPHAVGNATQATTANGHNDFIYCTQQTFPQFNG